MSDLKRRIFDWLDHRTGVETAIKDFFYEEIPGSSGWHQVFGSVAMFLFMVQAFTGILLSVNYAPTPGDAYNSLKYIVTEVTGGRLIHGLHHWGASMMIVVVVVHMTQVFLFGAYKKPREATWMVGVFLLLITLGFGLTGYLLPWDNRAYWGTVVTTQIAGQVPLLGPYLRRFLGTDGSVGVVTFARFYGLHVLILPPLTTFLVVFHIYLVRKHGVAPTPGDLAPAKKFFPEQMLKDVIAVFSAFVVLYLMALLVAVPLERLADPTDHTYIPRPDWYFLFLFQTLKFFNGPLEFVGSMVLPGLATLALFLAPFIDRSTLKRVTQRTTAIGIVVLGGVGWATLTAAAIVTTPKQSESVPAAQGAPAAWQQLSPGELVGLAYFRKENCKACHPTAPGSKKTIGPDLADAAQRHTGPWLIEHFKHPQQMVPGSAMPPVALPDDQLSALSMFILKINLNNEKALFSTPDDIVAGALVYQENHCESCHKVNGVGMQVGPALNGLAGRHTRDWVEQHFADPQKLVPGSSMPAYKFSPADLDHITSYIMQLP